MGIVGFFPMVGDLLHTGHIIAIEEAKKHCDYLIMGLQCNPTFKGKHLPVQSAYERFMQLRAVRWVDEIIPFDADAPDVEKLLSSLQFDVYFLGEDYVGKDFPGKQILVDRKKEIHYLPRYHAESTTELISRITEKRSEENKI